MMGIIITCGYVYVASARTVKMIRRSTIFYFLGWFVALTVCYIYFVLNWNPQVAKVQEDAAGNNYLFWVLVIVFVFALRWLIRERPVQLAAALKWLLLAHCAAIFLQTIGLLLTGKYLDFVAPFTGELSRYNNYENLNPVFAYRPTGLYVEPSNFSAAIVAMLIGYMLLTRSQGLPQSKLLILVSIVGMFITQSTAGVIQAVMMLVALFSMQGRKAKLWMSIALVIILTVGSAFIGAYFDSFVTKWNASAGLRFGLLDYIYNVRRGTDFWFGFGPFGIEDTLYQMQTSDQSQVASTNDSGLFNFFVVHFGILGIIFPALIFIKIEKTIANIILLSVLLSSKLSYTHPVLYFGLMPLMLIQVEGIPQFVKKRGRRTSDAPPSLLTE